MSRIAETFAALRTAQEGEKKALVAFITAGDPTLSHTVPAMHALVRGGADALELGIPFSDPEAEGPSIQASYERALTQHVRLQDVLEQVAKFRETDTTTPVILMGYLNSIISQNNFAERAERAGVDGLIMVNLPPEEAHELKQELLQRNIDLVFLVAPTSTDQRMAQIAAQSSGFLYYVSLKGITGASHIDVDSVAAMVGALRKHSSLPICVGFGIKDGEMARRVAQHADGVVVGSAFVNTLGAAAEHGFDADYVAGQIEQQARALRDAIDAG